MADDTDKIPILDSKSIDKAVKAIYEGFDVAEKIEPHLFEITLNAFTDAIDSVWGSVEFGETDFAFVQELKENTTVFSAFKTYTQQNEIASLLVDDDGKPRSFDSFRRKAEPLTDKYNVNYLQTEYNTAVQRAQVAKNIKEVSF